MSSHIGAFSLVLGFCYLTTTTAAHVERASSQVQVQDLMPFHNDTIDDERRNTHVLIEYKSVEGAPDAAVTIGVDVAQPNTCMHYEEYILGSDSGICAARENYSMRRHRARKSFLTYKRYYIGFDCEAAKPASPRSDPVRIYCFHRID